MKKEIAMEWVSALRSGKYKQTISSLKDNLGYCCIGVLCDLNKDSLNYNWDEWNYFRSYGTKAATAQTAPAHLLEFCELKSAAESVLISMNDGDDGYPKHSFSQIADYIEDNYENL